MTEVDLSELRRQIDEASPAHGPGRVVKLDRAYAKAILAAVEAGRSASARAALFRGINHDLIVILRKVLDDGVERAARLIESGGPTVAGAGAIAALRRAADQARSAQGAPRVRHRKRGTTYAVVGRASLQSVAPVEEGETVVVYRSEADGALWARPSSEFHDGRFEPIEGGADDL